MRILFLNHNVVGRGTWVRAAWLARELAILGHDITVLTTSPGRRASSREWESSGVRIIEAPDLLMGSARAGWDVWNATWRVRRLARERFDLIHGFDCRPVVLLPALAQRRRDDAPLFLDWADWWGRGGTIAERSGWPVRTFFGPVETWFEEAFRTDATANTTINEALCERCIGLGVERDRVAVLPNGCVQEEPLDHAESRSALGIADTPVVLHLGVMQKADAAFLFDAFRVARRRVPDARLVLVGPASGSIPVDLRATVHRTGWVDDRTMRLWLAAADTGVVPLRDTIASRGRWPGKLSEYLSSGLPVTMPAVGSAAALIGRAGAGRICDASSESFGTAIADTLEDEAARSTMSRSARRLAVGELAWSRIATQLVAFYEKCTRSAA